LRYQLPVYSPLSLQALRVAARATLSGEDPRPTLARSLAEEFDAGSVVLCGSGTDALARGIRLATSRVGKGAAVALPAYSCFDVATAAIGAGLPITLYDLDPNNLGPDLDSLRSALAEGVGVVVVAPLYGMPVDWAAIEEVTAPAGAILIEDAAQGQGASWRGRRLGSMGPFSVLSFGRGKGWTGGAGGALLERGGGRAGGEPAEPTSNGVILLSTMVQWAIGRPALYGLPASIPWLGLGETVYREPGQSREMARGAAAMIGATREAAAAAAVERRLLADFFLRRLQGGGILQSVVPVTPVPGALPGYLRLPLRIPGGAAFAKSAVVRRFGIAPGYPSTLGKLSALRSRLQGGDRSYPGAEVLVRELVTLPTHPLVSPPDRERIFDLLAGRI
jgi:hypothetical protein